MSQCYRNMEIVYVIIIFVMGMVVLGGITSDSTYAGAIASSGSSTTCNTSSDYRLKENVKLYI